ncbi:MAG: acyl-CoA thioesterase [Chloroflexi bacterium]|nr:acyl-CoA thioesterase [Chloroflexota bacterium]
MVDGGSIEPSAPGQSFLAVRTQVRWGDCDPAGIAFFPRFFEWMDLASHALAHEMGISREQTLGPASYGFPAVHAQAEFISPALLYDDLEIRTTVPKVGRTSLHLRHEVVRLADGAVLARGEAVRVHIRRRRGQVGHMVPYPLTRRMRAVLAQYAVSDGAGS